MSATSKITNKQYTSLVDHGQYPEDPGVPIDSHFENENGKISNLVLEKFSSAAIIQSVQGAIRANHFHKTDWHYTYILSGAVSYWWRPTGSKDRPKSRLFERGQMFFTPPLVDHAMYFPIESTIITFAKNLRDHDHHEEDVVRVPLILVKEGFIVVDPKALIP